MPALDAGRPVRFFWALLCVVVWLGACAGVTGQEPLMHIFSAL
jgi:hypothetical protein